MSGLFSELHRTSQALNAQSQGIYTAGRNMANVNNPAYARQRVMLGDRGTVSGPLGPQSLGVEALGLQSIRDRLLDAQVIRETSTTKYLEVLADAYANAETALGQAIDSSKNSTSVDGATTTQATHGIGEALDALLNAFSSLAASPRSEAERQTLYQQATTLVGRFHTVDQRLELIQTDLEAQVDADLQTVNDLLGSIAALNRQISEYEVGTPGGALDLRDSRQGKLEELAKYLNFSVEEVTGSAGQIRILSQDTGGNPVVLLDSSKTPPTFAFNGTNFTGGTAGAALTVDSGRLAAALAARDGVIADTRSGLNRLASQLVTAVNAAYNPDTNSDGTGDYTNFFNPAGLTAATIALDASVTSTNIRATTSLTNPGENEIAEAVADLATTVFSTGAGAQFDGTFGTYYRSIVSDVGNAAASAEGRYEDQATLLGLVAQRRDAVSGVSLDEEMTDLIKYQRAFDASARIMRVIDEMLQTVVRLGS